MREISLFTFLHTPTAYRNTTHGVDEVDSNTVYRLGSISKLLTACLSLLEAGDASWNEPVTNYISGADGAGVEAGSRPLD